MTDPAYEYCVESKAKLQVENDLLKDVIRDMWPLMALKSKWLERNPKYREIIREAIRE